MQHLIQYERTWHVRRKLKPPPPRPPRLSLGSSILLFFRINHTQRYNALSRFQAERENESLVQAQGKHEEDALSVAIGSFQQEFKTDLKAVKVGGGPYQV